MYAKTVCGFLDLWLIQTEAFLMKCACYLSTFHNVCLCLVYGAQSDAYQLIDKAPYNRPSIERKLSR